VQYEKQHQRNLIHSNVTSNRVLADLKLQTPYYSFGHMVTTLSHTMCYVTA